MTGMTDLMDWRVENQEDLKQFGRDTQQLTEEAAESIYLRGLYRRGFTGISNEIDRAQFLEWLGGLVDTKAPLTVWVNLERHERTSVILVMDCWAELAQE